MNEKALREYLKKTAGLVIDCRASVSSTNLLAKQWAREGGGLPALFAADSQSMGRGRLGRDFASPPGGLYMSLVLPCAGLEAGSLTTLAAVCALQAADSLGIPDVGVKWVNDLVQRGKKVGGILTEGIGGADGQIAQAVIGIGINTGAPRFDAELARKAAGLDWGPARPERERLAALIVEEILDGLPAIPAHMALYRARCLTLGKTVRFEREGAEYLGLAAGIRDDGALIVRTQKGELALHSGEVSVRNTEGNYLS